MSISITNNLLAKATSNNILSYTLKIINRSSQSFVHGHLLVKGLYGGNIMAHCNKYITSRKSIGNGVGLALKKVIKQGRNVYMMFSQFNTCSMAICTLRYSLKGSVTTLKAMLTPFYLSIINFCVFWALSLVF